MKLDKKTMEKEIAKVLKEYDWEKKLSSISLDQEEYVETEFTQLISDGVANIKSNMPFTFYYYPRNQNIKRIDLLLATYGAKIKNCPIKMDIHNALNDKKLYSKDFHLNLKDNQWHHFSFPALAIKDPAPLKLSFTFDLSEYDAEHIAVWYGRNVRAYGGTFYISTQGYEGTPSFRIHAETAPSTTPSIESSKWKMDFVSKTNQTLQAKSKKNMEALHHLEEEVEKIAHKYTELKTENTQTTQERDKIKHENSQLQQSCALQLTKLKELEHELKKVTSENHNLHTLLGFIRQQYTNERVQKWNSSIRKRLWSFRLNRTLSARQGVFPLMDLTLDLKVEQAAITTAPIQAIQLYIGTNGRINHGTLQYRVRNISGQVYGEGTLELSGLPNLEPVALPVHLDGGIPFILELNGPDSLPGNCITLIGSKEEAPGLGKLIVNDCTIKAKLKMDC